MREWRQRKNLPSNPKRNRSKPDAPTGRICELEDDVPNELSRLNILNFHLAIGCPSVSATAVGVSGALGKQGKLVKLRRPLLL